MLKQNILSWGRNRGGKGGLRLFDKLKIYVNSIRGWAEKLYIGNKTDI
jgi:hypothetical protein